MLEKHLNNEVVIDYDEENANWKDFFPNTSPVELYRTTTLGLPENTRLDVTLREPSDYSYTKYIEMEFNNKSDKHDFSFLYVIYKDFHYMRYARGNVAEQHQKNGISKTMQRNMLEFAQKSELDRIAINAMNIGVYAWTKVGFVPENPVWYITRQQIALRLDNIKKATSLRQRYSLSSQFNKMTKAVKSDNPKSIWTIADDNTPFHLDPSISWGKAMLLPNKQITSFNTGINISYSGELNMHDPDCVNRAEKYLNGIRPNKKAVLNAV